MNTHVCGQHCDILSRSSKCSSHSVERKLRLHRLLESKSHWFGWLKLNCQQVHPSRCPRHLDPSRDPSRDPSAIFSPANPTLWSCSKSSGAKVKPSWPCTLWMPCTPWRLEASRPSGQQAIRLSSCTKLDTKIPNVTKTHQESWLYPLQSKFSWCLACHKQLEQVAGQATPCS